MGVNVFDWPGNSADLTLIEKVWNIMKKESVKLSNNTIEKLLRNCKMKFLQRWKLCVRPKLGIPGTELLKAMV